jgi:uncharacterized delta-60 repeat protein
VGISPPPERERGTLSAYRSLHRAIALLALAWTPVLVAKLAEAAPGDLDPTFAGDGTVKTTPARDGGVANAVAIQTDGKIVAAGQSFGERPRFAVLRYTRRGRLDPTFGGDGRVITDVSRGDDQANGVAIQADGKIVVAGRSGKDNRKFALVRYNTDGTLDSTFAEDGKVTTDFTNARDQANAVAIQADGKIVAVGRSGGADFAVARFNTDGALDATFGGDGKVTTDFTHGDDPANAVAVQPDGKIVAAGGGPKLARYNIDGTLDPTFGGDGKVIPVLTCCPAFVSVYDATLQSNGKIITAGEWFECFAAGDCEDDVVVTRYDSDGTLDTTFASGGVAFGICGRANAVALQADGKIVAAGVVDCGGGDKAHGDFVIERLDADGARDGTFGNRGDVLTSFTPKWDQAEGVAIQANGKIVAVGAAAVFGPHPKFAVARYLPS